MTAAPQEKARKRACALILEHNDEILLLKRASTKRFGPNTWNLPGGSCEKDEEPLNASIRELYEEAGVKIDNAIFVNSQIMEEGTEFEVDYFVFYHKLNAKEKKPYITINDESSEFIWSTTDAALQLELCHGEDKTINTFRKWKQTTKLPIIAIQALIIKDDKLLVVREKDYYLLPGGKPHNGETQIETLRRELKEETNFTLESAEYFGTYNYPRALTVDRPLTLICYIATVSGTPKASSEVDELVWINKESYASSDKFPKNWWNVIFKDLKKHKIIDLLH